MEDLFDQQTMLVKTHHANLVDLETVFQRPFPTVLNDVYVYLPEKDFWPREMDRHYQVGVIWDSHLKILSQPGLNEAAKYGLKPTVAGPLANLLSFVAMNDHLLTAFAKQSLALPVLDTVLVSAKGNGFKGNNYHLLVKMIDQHHRLVSGEEIALTLLNQHTKPLSWESFCEAFKKYLSQAERLQFLKQFWFRVLSDCEIHPHQFVLHRQDHQAKLAPFSGVIPKGVYEIITEPEHQARELVEFANTSPANTPPAFWQLVATMKVKPSTFKEVAREFLGQWTYVLPEYIAQLQPLIQKVRFKKSLVPQGASHAQSWMGYLKRQHQHRAKQLEALGWYADLNLPAPTADYPLSQRDFCGKPPQPGQNSEQKRHQKPSQSCDQVDKPVLRNQLSLL